MSLRNIYDPAITELTELINKFRVLIKTGTSGAGISYKIIGQEWGKKNINGAKVGQTTAKQK
jgi:hypothetical protein